MKQCDQKNPLGCFYSKTEMINKTVLDTYKNRNRLCDLVSLGVSICLDMVSIETLDLDTFKSWSRQVLKTGLDCQDEVSTWLMP